MNQKQQTLDELLKEYDKIAGDIPVAELPKYHKTRDLIKKVYEAGGEAERERIYEDMRSFLDEVDWDHEAMKLLIVFLEEKK